MPVSDRHGEKEYPTVPARSKQAHYFPSARPEWLPVTRTALCDENGTVLADWRRHARHAGTCLAYRVTTAARTDIPRAARRRLAVVPNCRPAGGTPPLAGRAAAPRPPGWPPARR